MPAIEDAPAKPGVLVEGALLAEPDADRKAGRLHGVVSRRIFSLKQCRVDTFPEPQAAQFLMLLYV